MRIVAFVIILALISAVFSITANARDLEPCRLCNGKGDYHCKTCGNTGEVTCKGCNGTGIWNCPGEDGKGKCDNGYYICTNCQGKGYTQNYDEKGNPTDTAPCGYNNCNGTGKQVCWTCHGTPTAKCDGCNGTGKEECYVGTCKVSRAYGWKCPDCKGTGFILVGNPMPPKESNDGVRNIPSKGDYIVTNDKTWAGYSYGGSSSVKSDGNKVSSDSNSEKSNESKAESKNESSADNQSKSDDKNKSKTVSADMTLLPQNRNSDFDIPIPEQKQWSSVTPANSVRVEMGKMTDEEQRYFAGLSQEKLAQILTDIQSIVSSSVPGKTTPETDKIISDLAELNGYETPSDGRLVPLYFEGHLKIGFPVRVTVGLEKGVIDGGSDIFVYHISENGSVELLGPAEYITYEDGTVSSISFYTSSFSTFFTAARELNLNTKNEKESASAVSKNGISAVKIAFYLIVGIIIVLFAVAVIILAKKRKGKTKKS